MAGSKTKIALGKDINITFSVAYNNIAVNLEGQPTEVDIVDYNGNAQIVPHEVESNVVTAHFDGLAQKLLGAYDVRLWVYKDGDRQCLLDIVSAFELVKTTEEEITPDTSELNYIISTDTMSVGALPDSAEGGNVNISIVEDDGETRGEANTAGGTLNITLYNIKGGDNEVVQEIDEEDTVSAPSSAAVARYVASHTPAPQTATGSTAGVVIVGDGLDVAADGTISVYKLPTISNFAISPNLVEVGQEITSITPTFTLNKVMQSVKIGNTDVVSGTAISGSWTVTTNITITANDGKNSTTATQKITFGKRVYIGSNENLLEATEANIKALATTAIKTSKAYGNYKTTVDGYIYYAYPKSWGEAGYTYGGAPYSLVKVGEVDITAHGVTTTYVLYRTGTNVDSNITINIQ